MRRVFFISLISSFLTFLSVDITTAQHTIELKTEGQRFGVADLDHLWLSSSSSTSDIFFEQKMEFPQTHSVGTKLPRGAAINKEVWGQFGSGSSSPYSALPGSVTYSDVEGSGEVYLRIQYSKHSASTVPIEIYINGQKQAEFYPVNQFNWDQFTVTEWIKISLEGFELHTDLTGDVATSNEKSAGLQTGVLLKQNFPNPFQSVSSIAFMLPEASEARLVVYDLLGREVEVLLEGQISAGEHIVNYQPKGLPSGAYFYKLNTGKESFVRMMTITN